jgi:hypothetical protein
MIRKASRSNGHFDDWSSPAMTGSYVGEQFVRKNSMSLSGQVW